MPRELRALIAVYLTLGLCFATSIPLWEAPDAIWHYHFAAHLAAGRGLPTSVEQARTAPWRQQGSQPPLYHLLVAPLIWLADPGDGTFPADPAFNENPHHAVGTRGPGGNLAFMVHGSWEGLPWRGSVLAARLVSLAGLAFGLLALCGTWAGARALLPSRPGTALLAATIFALNPELLFFSGAISNDIAAAAAGSLVFWRAARLLGSRDPATLTRDALWLGLVCGLAGLTKLSGLWLLPPAALAMGIGAWRAHRASSGSALPAPRHHGPRAFAVWCATLSGVGGWWYLRNLLLFGDATGLPLMFGAMSRRSFAPGPRELGMQLWAVWRSYWGVFGWFNVPAPGWWFGLVSLAVFLALAALVAGLARGRFEPAERTGLMLASVFALSIGVGLLAWAQLQYPQGRLGFPGGPALALLLAAGPSAWLGEPAMRRLTRGLAASLGLVSLGLLIFVIWPAYRPTLARAASRSDAETRPLARFGPGLELLSATPDPSVLGLMPGESLAVDLTWRIDRSARRDLSVFIHLLDEAGNILAQRDSYPQSGRLSTSDWGRLRVRSAGQGWPAIADRLALLGPPVLAFQRGAAPVGPGGVLIPDRQLLELPATQASRCACRLLLGLYDARSGQRIADEAGREQREIGRLQVVPGIGQDGTPNPIRVPFGEAIDLVGYALERRAARPGEVLTIDLYWRARQAIEADYKVSLQLRDASGQMAGQRDERPVDGARDSYSWQPGERITDRHPLRIDDGAQPGGYRLYLVLYDAVSGRRLPVRWRDFELDLGPFTVRSEGSPGAQY